MFIFAVIKYSLIQLIIKWFMEESKIKGKRIECIIGVLLLIPPILGVFAFVL